MFKKKMEVETLKYKIKAESLLVNDFAEALKSINSQYHSFLKKKNEKIHKKLHELAIKEVEKGSYIITFVENVLENIDLVIITSMLLSGYFNYLKIIFENLLLDKTSYLVKNHDFTTNEAKDIIKILKPITINNNFSFISNKSNGTVNVINYNGEQSYAMQHVLDNYLKEVYSENIIRDKVKIMVTYQFITNATRITVIL
jgi:hypothetical protein